MPHCRSQTPSSDNPDNPDKPGNPDVADIADVPGRWWPAPSVHTAGRHANCERFQAWVDAGADRATLTALLQNGSTRYPLQEALAAAGKTLPDCGLVVLVGPPASGKTTLAEHLAATRGADIVSLDRIRSELFGREDHPGDIDQIVTLAHQRIAGGLRRGRLVISDATNVETHVLSQHLQLARAARACAVLIDVTVKRATAEARDRARHLQGKRAVSAPGGTWSDDTGRRVYDLMYQRRTLLGDLNELAANLGYDAIYTPDMLS